MCGWLLQCSEGDDNGPSWERRTCGIQKRPCCNACLSGLACSVVQIGRKVLHSVVASKVLGSLYFDNVQPLNIPGKAIWVYFSLPGAENTSVRECPRNHKHFTLWKSRRRSWNEFRWWQKSMFLQTRVSLDMIAKNKLMTVETRGMRCNITSTCFLKGLF